jgi:hypothetical protein
MPAQEATISSFGTPRRRPSAVHENASAALPDCHDYLNPLIAPPAASDGRSRSSQPRRWAIWLWIALWLTALAPRLWVATRLDTICNDAVFYIQLAEGYQRGDVEAGLGRLRLNTYPPVLAMLHRAGLDWELAGKCWGVLLASLAVLPLAGWLRRQFDDRLALVACVLYAFHPKLIEWSPELVRDPASWFCWTAALYASWRAASETRLVWYLAAGAAIAIAIQTRFEGWFLYLPLAWWSVCRCLVQPHARLRAAVGCVTALAMSPLLVVAVNVTLLARQPTWEWGNFNRLQYVALWSQASWQAMIGPSATTRGTGGGNGTTKFSSGSAPAARTSMPAALAATVPAEPPRHLAPGKLAWLFVNNLRRGFGVLFELLWLTGFCCRPRLWLRRDHLVLWLLAGCVAAGIWVHLWYAQATSSRYYLAIVLLAFPCAAMGWCWLCGRLAWLAVGAARCGGRNLQRRRAWAVAMVFAILVTGGAGLTEALIAHRGGRQREAALGRWILAERGPGQHILTARPAVLVGYYAQATASPATGDAPESAAASAQADLAIAFRHSASAAEISRFVSRSRGAGLLPVDSRRLPSGFDWSDVIVLEKASTPKAAS